MDPIASDDRDRGGWTFPAGTAVVGADGAPIGTVVAAHPFHLAVRRGRLRRRAYVPKAEVANYDGATITLAVTGAEARDRGWAKRPTEP
jgi:hypothetical protein